MWAEEVGVVPVASFTITKLAWLRDSRPELAAQVEQVLLPHDWLTWNILGRPDEPTTDRSDASGTGYFSVHSNDYRLDLLEAALGRAARVPRVLGPSARAGRTPGGVIVSAGAGDNAAAALGLGADEGDVVVSIGTSGTVFASTAARITDASGSVAGFADVAGGQLPLIATINGARTLVATARMLDVDIARFGALALAAPIDADGLLMLPYLDGERTPNLPGASGHFDRRRLAVARRAEDCGGCLRRAGRAACTRRIRGPRRRPAGGLGPRWWLSAVEARSCDRTRALGHPGLGRRRARALRRAARHDLRSLSG